MKGSIKNISSPNGVYYKKNVAHQDTFAPDSEIIERSYDEDSVSGTSFN